MSGSIGPVGGAGSILIAGVPYNLNESSYCPTAVTRETKKGQSGVFGYSEMPAAPYITCTITKVGGMSVADFNAMSNVTVALTLDDGSNILGSNMWTVEAQVVNTVEGTFELRFEGPIGCIQEN